MIAVAVDWPVSKDDIGSLRLEEAGEILVMRRIDDRVAIMLSCKHGAGVKDTARILGFGRANSRTATKARSSAESVAAIQVEQNDLMAEIAIAGDGSGTAAFRVAGMAADHHNFKRPPRGFRNRS